MCVLLQGVYIDNHPCACQEFCQSWQCWCAVLAGRMLHHTQHVCSAEAWPDLIFELRLQWWVLAEPQCTNVCCLSRMCPLCAALYLLSRRGASVAIPTDAFPGLLSRGSQRDAACHRHQRHAARFHQCLLQRVKEALGTCHPPDVRVVYVHQHVLLLVPLGQQANGCWCSLCPWRASSEPRSSAK